MTHVEINLALKIKELAEIKEKAADLKFQLTQSENKGLALLKQIKTAE